MPPRILAILPCFNESGALARVIDGIRASAPEVDILVVDDASIDDTSSIAANSSAIVARLPVNLGIGGAVQTGYRYARNHDYDVAIQVDGDGQHPAAHIAQLASVVAEGSADLVVGSRYCARRFEGNVSSVGRVMGSLLLSIAIKLLSGGRVSDPTSGFRAVSRNLILLFSEEYPYDYPEPISALTALMRGYRVREIPVEMNRRLEGRSSIRPLHTALYMVKVTWTMCLKRIYG